MKKNKFVYLSWMLNESTPSYGNREKLEIAKTASIKSGDVGNHTKISMSTHLGTHIDMPYHFFEDGQTIEDFDADFWLFNKIGFLEIKPLGFVIKDELLDKIGTLDTDIEILIVKTGASDNRNSKDFIYKNFGFHQDVADSLRSKFKNLRIFGFDCISVSSLTNRNMGREAHKNFLKPSCPILLLEDMKLDILDGLKIFEKIIIAPIRIENCDGLPCTVFGFEGK